MPQSAEITGLGVDLTSVNGGALIHMAIYNDVGSNPSNLIYLSPLSLAILGANIINIPVTVNLQLAAGNYWIAVNNVGGSAAVVYASGGAPTSLTILNGQDMPNPYPPPATPSYDTINKGYLSGTYNSCNFTAVSTPLPTNTFVPTNTPTFTPTGSPTYTSTATNSPTSTFTATHTCPPPLPTSTFTPTPTFTPTGTITNTPTSTPTGTLTPSPTPTDTPTPTNTGTPTSCP